MAQPNTLNAEAVQALKVIREALGIRSGARFARKLAEAAGGSPDPSTYNRWERGEQLVPAWALIAAIHLSELPLAEVFGTQPARQVALQTELLDQVLERLSAIETRLDDGGQFGRPDLDDSLGSLQAHVLALQDRLALLESASHLSHNAAQAQ